MKAALLTEPFRIALVDRDLAPLGPQQVRLRVDQCGICTSELDLWTGKAVEQLPAAIGHEVAGVVEEVGAEVTTLRTGDRVAAWVEGGGFAEATVVEERFCIPVAAGRHLRRGRRAARLHRQRGRAGRAGARRRRRDHRRRLHGQPAAARLRPQGAAHGDGRRHPAGRPRARPLARRDARRRHGERVARRRRPRGHRRARRRRDLRGHRHRPGPRARGRGDADERQALHRRLPPGRRAVDPARRPGTGWRSSW